MIGFKKLHPDAILPTYATAGAACFDLYAVDNAVVLPGDCVALRTGLAVNLPANLALLIYSRSGHGFKYGVRLVNCVGVIDSDYKGEIMVNGAAARHAQVGDRLIVITYGLCSEDEARALKPRVLILDERNRISGAFAP